MDKTKRERYYDLVSKVKASYHQYSPDEQDDRLKLYWCNDCHEINLWTYWQGRNNLDAEIMLVGQDWGSPWDDAAQGTMEQIKLAELGEPYDYLQNNPSKTDEHLISLFQEIGIFDVSKPCDKLFFTNLVLGYRSKGLSGGYSAKWAEHDKDFFRELVGIIEPKIVLCLGRATFEGVLLSLNIKLKPRIGKFNDFIESDRNPVAAPLNNSNVVHIFALAHCGALGTLNRNRGKGEMDDILEVQKRDWKRVIPYL